jgi:tRNA pseudouridine55 synthase
VKPLKSASQVNGVLLLDKPVGLTSNAALQRTKRLLNAAKAGHTGTLDPLASGLLPLCFGEATRFSGALLDADKSYLACIRLGETTRTGDAEGEVLTRCAVDVSREQLAGCLQRFVGDIEQTPPMFSALKHKGRPLYQYARSGVQVEREGRTVTIRSIELERFSGEDLEIRVTCSKGTYIRVLAEGIGQALGCGAHLSGLRRTRVGEMSETAAIALPDLEALSPSGRLEQLRPVDEFLSSFPAFTFDAERARRLLKGQPLAHCAEGGPGTVRLYDPEGRFLGLGDYDAEGIVRPKRVISLEALCH